MLLLASYALAAGYGVPVDGYPSVDERSLLLWTNAARVAPDAFTDEYTAGGCSTADFSEDELTPKPPLYVDLALTEVARVHSTDMKENGCFQHESCDGTDTWDRILAYYFDANTGLGENIAEGYGTPRATVLTGWMCSHSGHRANIMSGGFNEMGPGVDDQFMTQDFAGGELKEGSPPVRMAILEDGAYYADWGDAAAPTALSVVRDGRSTPMTLAWGVAENGIYTATGAAEDADAGTHSWYVAWEGSTGSGAFPESGAFTDDGSYTEARQEPVDPEAVAAGLKLTGCAHAPGAAALAPALAAAALISRRRRERPARG